MVTAVELTKQQKGGIALLEKYGTDYMRALGKKGGRPRSITINDIEGQRRW